MPKRSLEISEEKYFSKIRKSDRERLRSVCEALIRGDVDKVKEEFLIYRSGRSNPNFDWIEVQAIVEKRDERGCPIVLTGSSLRITERKG